MTDLPQGWEWSTLGEISATALGKMLDRGKSVAACPAPYLRNSNVHWGHIDLADVNTMDIPLDEREYFRLMPGDVLVCEGGEIGRCAIWPGSHDYMAFQKAIHRIRPYGGIEPGYLSYLFEHLSMTGTLLAYSTGSTIKHLPQEQLRRLPVPVPPLAEQRRIVATLEDHLARLVGATADLERASLRAGRARDVLIANEVDVHAHEAVQLGLFLREPLTNGRSVPTGPGGFPVLRLTALRGDRLDLSERKDGAWSADEASSYLVRRGDYFVSRGNGSLSLVGRGALLDETPDPVAFPDTLIRVRIRDDVLLPEFLNLVWNSRRVRAQIEGSARTTAGIYKINQRIIERILIPVPTMEDQRAIVARISEQSQLLTVGRTLATTARSRASSLRRSLLAEAFSGRLVPQDPGDEPASELLGRIRVERAKAGPGRRTRKAGPARPVQEELS
ncbi:MAG TPA: restriction endonuclease subunit S [Pseudonocardiaceae bacterium]|nr:restriction endonuclease subunit S [Pseudonocardiaceae bacterium]